MRSYLDFEKPVAELEAKVEELRALGENRDAVSISDDITRLETKAAEALKDLYGKLTPWQKTLVARHPQRPHFVDYCAGLITDFTPLAGDRKFGEDEAIVGGFGRFRGSAVCVLGQEKGHSTDTRIRHNFGMARPEGYRKAVRLMELADRFEPAGAVLRGYGRRLSGHRGGGARPGRGHRPLHRDAALARRPQRVAGDRRGRLRRRDRDRHRQQGADARTRDLQRDFARGRGLDPVARFRPARRTPPPT